MERFTEKVLEYYTDANPTEKPQLASCRRGDTSRRKAGAAPAEESHNGLGPAIKLFADLTNYLEPLTSIVKEQLDGSDQGFGVPDAKRRISRRARVSQPTSKPFNKAADSFELDYCC